MEHFQNYKKNDYNFNDLFEIKWNMYPQISFLKKKAEGNLKIGQSVRG